MTYRPGFIAIPRAVLESAWYRAASPLARALWLELLSLANYTASTTRKGLTLQPGQLVTSWGHLRERLSFTGRGGRPEYPPLMNIRRTAAFLEKAGEAAYTVAGKAAGGGTVVTLLRWALYAGPPSQAADLAADITNKRYAGIAAIQEQEDLPLPESRGEKTSTRQERKRQAIEETRRILREERILREGVPDGAVH